MPAQDSLGKYHIETFLGKGAFAEVYKALDSSLKRMVALKVLKPALIADEEAFARFVNEARVLADLVHPQIAWVWDMGEAEGRCFIAMRYVEGQSLDKVIADRGPLPWAEALKIIREVAGALEFAHKKGLVHRDVKPQNIIRSDMEGSVLTDFGLVKALHSSGMSSTTTMIGTPAYMAPELWDGGEASPASDQYALACVLVEMLTGLTLFAGSTATIMKKHLMEVPALPEKYSREVPDGLQAVLLKALGKQPEGRYADVMEFLSALGGLGVDDEPELEETPAEISEDALPIMPTESSVIQHPKHPKPWLWIIGIGLFVIIGGFILFKLKSDNPSPPATPTTQPTIGITPLFTPTTIPEIFNESIIRTADWMVMIPVQAGEFIMGSDSGQMNEHPTHKVYLDGYWIDQTEVTNGMYDKCVKAGICQRPESDSSQTLLSYYGNTQYVNYPVIYVNWEDARTYCEWAEARLPTEAEWEKAARGKDGSVFPWGKAVPDINRANYFSNVGDTTEVGSYPTGASPYGALDMAGNVWEWVNDWYDESYYSYSQSDNPPGPLTGENKILRGGAFNDYDGQIRIYSSYRREAIPDLESFNIGFRCVRSENQFQVTTSP